MKVVILCGGKGTRIGEISGVFPKPMLSIGSKPILWHIMKIYATYGLNDFILCLGHNGWKIKEFFCNLRAMVSDITVKLGNDNEIEFHNNIQEAGWKITLVETGQDTMTGGRIWLIKKYLEGCDNFCLTYGDGVADINIAELIEKHRQSGLVGTMTVVRVRSRFGEVKFKEGKITTFDEKPAISTSMVNGGFMLFNTSQIWDYLDERPDLVFENEPLDRMTTDEQLGVYEHNGYWQCLDTPREYAMLNELWEKGIAPWKTW